MATQCIVCGHAAGSHEHVFPAALGGRRTNQNIYCKNHNAAFSRHVAVLEKQLSFLNAVIEVRADKRDSPKPFVFVNENDEGYSIVGETFETAMPGGIDSLKRTPVGESLVEVASVRQFEVWREQQRKAGREVKVVGKTEFQNRHIVGPQRIQLTFGGKEFLQATAYLGLTFFAQYFPEAVRQGGLAPFIRFLEADFTNAAASQGWVPNLVWWDGRDSEALVGPNPYAFGHAVVVGVSRNVGHAYAYVSLFSALNVCIDLGPVPGTDERMVRVFIDPKAENARSDINVAQFDKFSIGIDPGSSALEEMTRAGSHEAAIRRFFDKAARYLLARFVESISTDLSRWAGQGAARPTEFAATLVDTHGQRILNVLDRAATRLHEHLKSGPLPKHILDNTLRKVLESDESQPTGISVKTRAHLQHAKAEIAIAIQRELRKPEPSAEGIASLLEGDLALAIVTKKVLGPLLLDAVSNARH